MHGLLPSLTPLPQRVDRVRSAAPPHPEQLQEELRQRDELVASLRGEIERLKQEACDARIALESSNACIGALEKEIDLRREQEARDRQKLAELQDNLAKGTDQLAAENAGLKLELREAEKKLFDAMRASRGAEAGPSANGAHAAHGTGGEAAAESPLVVKHLERELVSAKAEIEGLRRAARRGPVKEYFDLKERLQSEFVQVQSQVQKELDEYQASASMTMRAMHNQIEAESRSHLESKRRADGLQVQLDVARQEIDYLCTDGWKGKSRAYRSLSLGLQDSTNKVLQLEAQINRQQDAISERDGAIGDLEDRLRGARLQIEAMQGAGGRVPLHLAIGGTGGAPGPPARQDSRVSARSEADDDGELPDEAPDWVRHEIGRSSN